MLPIPDPLEDTDIDQAVLFGSICDDLVAKSYSVQRNALPHGLVKLLSERARYEDDLQYTPAGIGRAIDHQKNQTIPRIRRFSGRSGNDVGVIAGLPPPVLLPAWHQPAH